MRFAAICAALLLTMSASLVLHAEAGRRGGRSVTSAWGGFRFRFASSNRAGNDELSDELGEEDELQSDLESLVGQTMTPQMLRSLRVAIRDKARRALCAPQISRLDSAAEFVELKDGNMAHDGLGSASRNSKNASDSESAAAFKGGFRAGYEAKLEKQRMNLMASRAGKVIDEWELKNRRINDKYFENLKKQAEHDGSRGRSYNITKQFWDTIRFENGDSNGKPISGGDAKMWCMINAEMSCGCPMWTLKMVDGLGQGEVAHNDYFGDAFYGNRRRATRDGRYFGITTAEECNKHDRCAFFGTDPKDPFELEPCDKKQDRWECPPSLAAKYKALDKERKAAVNKGTYKWENNGLVGSKQGMGTGFCACLNGDQNDFRALRNCGRWVPNPHVQPTCIDHDSTKEWTWRANCTPGCADVKDGICLGNKCKHEYACGKPYDKDKCKASLKESYGYNCEPEYQRWKTPNRSLTSDELVTDYSIGSTSWEMLFGKCQVGGAGLIVHDPRKKTAQPCQRNRNHAGCMHGEYYDKHRQLVEQTKYNPKTLRSNKLNIDGTDFETIEAFRGGLFSIQDDLGKVIKPGWDRDGNKDGAHHPGFTPGFVKNGRYGGLVCSAWASVCTKDKTGAPEECKTEKRNYGCLDKNNLKWYSDCSAIPQQNILTVLS